MSISYPAVAAWCLTVCLLATAAAGMRWRRHAAALKRLLENRDAEARHLAEARLPAVAESTRSLNIPVPGTLHESTADTPFGQSLEAVVNSFARSQETARLRADRATRASLASAMRSVQSLANEQQLAISAMQERHDDPQVLQGMLEIDHMNAQIGRRAQAVAVLSGSWPGRQRSASPVLAVVRGATSRIRDYRRVNIRGQAAVAVMSRAVEPVVLAVAELLDNAARHSPLDTPIDVVIQSSHHGTSIVIDDCGIGMSHEELWQASTLLAGERQVDVTRLGNPPAFGHAVVGQLASRYGFRAFVDSSSPFGGVRATIFLPVGLLVPIDNSAGGQASAMPRRPAPGPGNAQPEAQGFAGPSTHREPQAQERTADGLPQRRRRQHAADGAGDSAATTQPPSVRPSVRSSSAVLGAFQRGTRAGRLPGPPPFHGLPGTEGTQSGERQ
ncbi:ATP-binding protein [Kitasatospora indigofera]|uniref:ATP-binding protein n=1 Tax=Kitasatospora indigofera TaxID=67307 RepID=UPI00367F307C